MRILHIVEATTAGVGRHVLDLATHMRASGVDVAVSCPRVRDGARNDTSFVEQLASKGVPVELVPMRRGVRPLSDARAYAHLVGLLGAQGYDIVHAHSSKAGVLGRLSARRCGTMRVVYTPNAFAFLGARTVLLRWLYLVIERFLGHWCTDALVCVSRSEMELAAERGVAPRQRLVLIENAIDVTRFSPSLDRNLTRFQLGIGETQVLIGYIGRLARQKGLGCLLEAARLVVDRAPSVRFVVVGEGDLERTVRSKISAYGLRDHVVLTGFRTDVPQLLAALDIFVLPSEYEGLPYTLMEAMASGCSAVATQIGGNRDLIENGVTGILVPPSAPEVMAEALLRLVACADERDRLGRAARSAARSRTTPLQMAETVLGLYARLLEEKGSDS